MMPFIYFVPNLYFTLFVTFYLSYLFIELTLRVFRIRAPLWQYLFRLIPFIKLPLDFFFFRFSNWTLTNHVPLLTQPQNAKSLSASLNVGLLPKYSLYFHMTDHSYGFGLFDMIAEKIGFIATLILALILLLHSFIRFLFWLKSVSLEFKFQEPELIAFPLKLLRPSLQKEVEKKKAAIFVSSRKGFSPYVKLGRKPLFILPCEICKTLSVEEIEATISHELGHLHPLAHFTAPYISLIKALFFFVTTKQILQTLERWCDTFIYRFHIHKTCIAQSISKISQTLTTNKQAYLPTFIKRSLAFSRIEAILTVSPKVHLVKALFYTLILTYFSLFVFLGQVGHF